MTSSLQAPGRDKIVVDCISWLILRQWDPIKNCSLSAPLPVHSSPQAPFPPGVTFSRSTQQSSISLEPLQFKRRTKKNRKEPVQYPSWQTGFSHYIYRRKMIFKLLLAWLLVFPHLDLHASYKPLEQRGCSNIIRTLCDWVQPDGGGIYQKRLV